ncbi:MAG: bifunctional diaminohydroxyphosphoribosylaminopyrimidine deaminase/5-amino-6-(5-phosphoribosylamino)uracil reductase RibD [Marinilabiliaceae bacterium]|nr:bifunctional diaminohydroxyphosphoribosylaminopyrimidine deaminase/5-amino-6-(5-phosphoribosylamino)uracil reductase RibD [Marinilabiliaceae bacterium]
MTQSLSDEYYMYRCLQLAKMAEGHTYPNPMVGSVVVCEGKIIGEGYHRKAGEPHAEVNAINSVKNPLLLKYSTLYVNLEPCAHFGKTPPCSLLIIEKEIPRVVIGCVDTFSEVAGKGIQMMRNKGIEVCVGVLEQESRFLNRRFFTVHEKKRPYIILKWAQTLDGFLDIDRNVLEQGQPNWITNEYARQAVHHLRTTEQSIIVGTNTALCDNPSLTVRSWYGHQPLRIVIDKYLRLPKKLNLFDGQWPTLVVTYKNAESSNNIDYLKVDNEEELVSQVIEYLYKLNIQSLIVEGGAELLTSFIKLSLWDEAHLYVGNVVFYQGIKAPVVKGELAGQTSFEESSLFIYRNNSLY